MIKICSLLWLLLSTGILKAWRNPALQRPLFLYAVLRCCCAAVSIFQFTLATLNSAAALPLGAAVMHLVAFALHRVSIALHLVSRCTVAQSCSLPCTVVWCRCIIIIIAVLHIAAILVHFHAFCCCIIFCCCTMPWSCSCELPLQYGTLILHCILLLPLAYNLQLLHRTLHCILR